MDLLLSPVGIGVSVVLIAAIVSVTCWQRKPIWKWLSRWWLDEVEVGGGPIKAKFRRKREEKGSSSAGVSFGEEGDYSGAKISGVAGRDIRRGSNAAQSADGKSPGVDFGTGTKLRDAEVEDVAGRDIVEDDS